MTNKKILISNAFKVFSEEAPPLLRHPQPRSTTFKPKRNPIPKNRSFLHRYDSKRLER